MSTNTASNTASNPTIEELQALLAKQQAEIAAKEAKIRELESKKSKTKGDTIFKLIESHLNVGAPDPDPTLIVDICALFIQKVVEETVYTPNPDRFTAEFGASTLDDAMEYLGYMRNPKRFGCTKGASKTKYSFEDFDELPANEYIKYYLQKPAVEEPTLTAEDF